ncbi:Cenp-O kinetochore centromere component-domain-containing protein [Leptodontidium sp. MPI-SDFR-AT-0119]|nr:Cenp-O kinetochore centromere component-domain-containing protein [Leptodontidium sp. MPI-SDFR-AT-0119]
MLPSIDDPTRSDAVGAQLDSEISSLQAQILALKSQRKLQVATILSSRHTKATLTRLRASQRPTPHSESQSVPTDTTPLLAAATAQRAHKQENLYRACAGITTFRVQDPDPNAVDGGKVLGIRIDVSSVGKFIKPYYIMLNKPWPGTELLRVHRHTVPASIPLTALVERYLPSGKGSVAMGEENPGGKKQDLRRFVRALRKEVVGYHNRTSVIKGLRREFKLDEKESKKGKSREKVITDISAADAEAKQVRIEWADGRIGRVVIDEKGEVKQCVIIGEDGRDGETERRVLAGSMEGIGERMREGMY